MRLVPLVSADSLQADHAAQNHQWKLQEAVPGLEVLGHMTTSRRDIDLLFQVAVLHELDLEKQKGLEELSEEQRHLTQWIASCCVRVRPVPTRARGAGA